MTLKIKIDKGLALKVILFFPLMQPHCRFPEKMRRKQTSGMQSWNVSLLSEARGRVKSGRVYHCGGVCVCVCEKDEGCAQVVGSSEREAVTCNHFLPLPSPGICRLTMPLSVFRLIQVNRWIYPERSQRRGLINTLKDGTGSRGGIHLSPTTWPDGRQQLPLWLSKHWAKEGKISFSHQPSFRRFTDCQS